MTNNEFKVYVAEKYAAAVKSNDKEQIKLLSDAAKMVKYMSGPALRSWPSHGVRLLRLPCPGRAGRS